MCHGLQNRFSVNANVTFVAYGTGRDGSFGHKLLFNGGKPDVAY